MTLRESIESAARDGVALALGVPEVRKVAALIKAADRVYNHLSDDPVFEPLDAALDSLSTPPDDGR